MQQFCAHQPVMERLSQRRVAMHQVVAPCSRRRSPGVLTQQRHSPIATSVASSDGAGEAPSYGLPPDTPTVSVPVSATAADMVADPNPATHSHFAASPSAPPSDHTSHQYVSGNRQHEQEQDGNPQQPPTDGDAASLSQPPCASLDGDGKPQEQQQETRQDPGRNHGDRQHQGSGRHGGREPPDSPASTSAPSTSGSRRPWPGRGRSSSTRNRDNSNANHDGATGGGGAYRPRFLPQPAWTPPVYADALSGRFAWPRTRHVSYRALFLNDFPVPPGKTFNVNSFLGKKEPQGGRYLVPPARYLEFLTSYHSALEDGVQMFLTENYHQQVFKYFLELDWEWDTDLALVMEVTPPLIELISRVAGEFYKQPFPNAITSIRTPFKIHINYPQLLTTEMLACMCRDRILDACRERFPQHADRINWERLIDFPHGSLRLMGSRKAWHMDRDPEWVQEKAYYPARLTDGKWRPGKLTVPLLGAASIFPPPRQAAAFERTPAYVDMVFMDLEAYKEKVEERRRRRAADREQAEGARTGPRGAGDGPGRQLPAGSSRNPLAVTIEVKQDETVSLNIYIKSKWRTQGQMRFNANRDEPAEASGKAPGQAAAGEAAAGEEAAGEEAAGQAAPAAVATCAEVATNTIEGGPAAEAGGAPEAVIVSCLAEDTGQGPSASAAGGSDGTGLDASPAPAATQEGDDVKKRQGQTGEAANETPSLPQEEEPGPGPHQTVDPGAGVRGVEAAGLRQVLDQAAAGTHTSACDEGAAPSGPQQRDVAPAVVAEAVSVS